GLFDSAVHLVSLAARGMDRMWHARRDSDPQPAVLETAALPIELLAYRVVCRGWKRQRRLAPPLPATGFSADPRPPGAGQAALLDDLAHHAGADGAAALADREAQALVHGHRVDQLNRHLHVVARHHHLHALRQGHRAGDVRGAEVELRAVALEERGVTAALVLAQHVHLGFEAGVRGDRARLGQHLAALHVVTLGAAQQQARVVARLALVEQLAEHLNARDRGLGGRTDAHDLDLLAHLDHAALDAARHHRATAGDREHVLHR